MRSHDLTNWAGSKNAQFYGDISSFSLCYVLKLGSLVTWRVFLSVNPVNEVKIRLYFLKKIVWRRNETCCQDLNFYQFCSNAFIPSAVRIIFQTKLQLFIDYTAHRKLNCFFSRVCLHVYFENLGNIWDRTQWGAREWIVISDSVTKFTYGSNNILDVLDVSSKRL